MRQPTHGASTATFQGTSANCPTSPRFPRGARRLGSRSTKSPSPAPDHRADPWSPQERSRPHFRCSPGTEATSLPGGLGSASPQSPRKSLTVSTSRLSRSVWQRSRAPTAPAADCSVVAIGLVRSGADQAIRGDLRGAGDRFRPRGVVQIESCVAPAMGQDSPLSGDVDRLLVCRRWGYVVGASASAGRRLRADAKPPVHLAAGGTMSPCKRKAAGLSM